VEESIAEFVVRRLNQEFLDHAIDALVAGIYAGDPHKLSLPHAFPKLKALEDNYGSMIKGQIFGARDRKKSGEVAKDRAAKFSFDEGLQVLPDTLAAQLGDSVKLNSPVTKTHANERRLARDDGERRNRIWCGDLLRHGAPAGGVGQIEAAPQRRPTDVFSEISYPPVASVVLGFRREDVAHSCEGFGMLIPKIEGFKILGTIFSSALFPNRAPAGQLNLTSYVGGARYPELASLPPEKLVKRAGGFAQIARRARPTRLSHTAFWPRAIPQYNVGYGKYRDLLTNIEAKTPDSFSPVIIATAFRWAIRWFRA
jgi:oxygen-dependent protoporphyrinogen oxidase